MDGRSTETSFPSDREILGYSRWVVFVAAFLAMGVISPFEYAFSAMKGPMGQFYHWDKLHFGWMFTLFVIFESLGTLPGGILRDKIGPRPVMIVGGLLGGVGLWAATLGHISYALVLFIWCVGSFFAGFVYNAAVTTANKWFPDLRGVTAGLIAGAFAWGSIPWIMPIGSLKHGNAPEVQFFHIIYMVAAILAGVCFVAAMFMKDPPAGWRPPGWTPQTVTKRPSEHQFTLSEVMGTWQLWVLMLSFILIAGAGLAGVSKIVGYAHSFHFDTAKALKAAGYVSIANGFGRVVLGSLSERIGRENAMILSYVLTGAFLALTLAAGQAHSPFLFVLCVFMAYFFWGPLFSLFPTVIGHYYGEVSAGSNYGILYAIAKGVAGIFGGVLSAGLIKQFGYPVFISVAAGMAVAAGLIIIPLKSSPPIKHPDEALAAGKAAAE